ncbi:MAG: hypothetical protein ISN28_06550 [Ectothiorhodospiraceae bacterium AqS1]|nr:hypothetical protein [Ectothiorhodospiraceae bacterium AqS1]
MTIDILLFVEDRLTEAVVGKIFRQVDRCLSVCQCHHWNKDKIQKKIGDLNRAAKGDFLYLGFTDQDTLGNCPASALKNLRAPLSCNLLYRFAVMEAESWIMADRKNIARFLAIDISSVPRAPDEVPEPKERMVAMAKKSRSRSLREDLAPAPSAKTAVVGPGYNSRLIEFVGDRWDAFEARRHSPSLERSVRRLQAFELSGA